MNESSPAYYAIIPSSVRYDPHLTSTEKLLYGEISALTNKEGYCWATNAYFAKLYSVSNRTISRSISKLQKYGYIKIQLNEEKQGVRCMYLWTEMSRGTTIMSRGVDKDVAATLDKNVQHNNIKINNKKNIYKHAPRTHHQGKPWRFYFDEILKLFGAFLDKHPRIAQPQKLTEARKKSVKARMLDDMPDLEDWEEYFYFIGISKFLTQECTASSFDWFLRPTVMQNVKEGKYHSEEEGKYEPYERIKEEKKNASMQ